MKENVKRADLKTYIYKNLVASMTYILSDLFSCCVMILRKMIFSMFQRNHICHLEVCLILPIKICTQRTFTSFAPGYYISGIIYGGLRQKVTCEWTRWHLSIIRASGKYHYIIREWRYVFPIWFLGNIKR